MVTRWKVTASGNRVERSGKPLLEVLCVRRVDGNWALPGAIGSNAEVAMKNIMNKAFGMSDPHLATALLNEITRLQGVLKAHAKPIYKVP